MENFGELKQLLSQASVSGDINGINAALKMYAEFFAGLPFNPQFEEKPDSPYLLMLRSVNSVPDKPRILLVGHIDTIFAPDKIEVREDGDKLYGSGTQDMKGGLIVILEALRSINSENLLTNIDVMVNPQEELGAR